MGYRKRRRSTVTVRYSEEMSVFSDEDHHENNQETETMDDLYEIIEN
jgi:hypothetical protein